MAPDGNVSPKRIVILVGTQTVNKPTHQITHMINNWKKKEEKCTSILKYFLELKYLNRKSKAPILL